VELYDAPQSIGSFRLIRSGLAGSDLAALSAANFYVGPEGHADGQHFSAPAHSPAGAAVSEVRLHLGCTAPEECNKNIYSVEKISCRLYLKLYSY
jgi:hypothetical protein